MSRKPTPTELLLGLLAILLGILAVLSVLWQVHPAVLLVEVVGIAFIAWLAIRLSRDSDRLQARQTERTLELATETLTLLREGLNEEAGLGICALLLPETSADAVAITDRELVLGFAGVEQDRFPVGQPIRTRATRSVLESGQMQVVSTREEIGAPLPDLSFQGAVIVPLLNAGEAVGTLKFYYRRASRIDATEQAMARGLGNLLSMQLLLVELEAEREQATVMELRALQAQINPHFLFNTINTIASLIRTNPAQARILLREFATFYRRTLEGSLDHISLEQEYLQTLRYFGFELARFGHERMELSTSIAPGLERITVPAFIIQPLVENSVAHALTADRCLHIQVSCAEEDGEVVIRVTDDGQGMDPATLSHALSDTAPRGSIALRNVDDRLRGFFGGQAHLELASQLGKGTVVTLHLGPQRRLRGSRADDRAQLSSAGRQRETSGIGGR